MDHLRLVQLLTLLTVTLAFSVSSACSDGKCKLLDYCSEDSDCGVGLYCLSCQSRFPICVRSSYTDQFKLLNNSLPFNKYAYLTTHNSFAIEGEPSHTGLPRLSVNYQEDTVTQQLNNGVRALMLDTYDYEGDVWLCHYFGGNCHRYTAFVRITASSK
ncbi:hypothetical protein SAY86_014965 [Trapa natans]|uniref:Uncharacterized protein n=1 Tax=Trapa natans TaxID=22666 RepID=A0AAN7KPF0_TRANT|nr:hypothetical protein SAY86_014965 [Trapa natans]